MDKPNIITLPPFIFFGAFAIGFAIHYLFPVPFLLPDPAIRVGMFLLLVSFMLVVLAIRELVRAKTTFDVRKPSTAIVDKGVFRFSRNPMYLSGILLYMGIASVINSFWIALFLIPLIVVIQQGVIKPEEKYLEQKFGENYLQYKTKVRRWL